VSSGLHDAVEERLRAAGQRYTTKRRALVEALSRAGRPSATRELVAAAGQPQSSVYRNLAVLEQAGAVRRVLTEGGLARYELAEDLTAHHHHLVCRSCGAVEDVTVPEPLEREVERVLAAAARRAGFRGFSHRLDLVGTCRSCGRVGRRVRA
jgi:Fe2+ or Zn2+ uptake regulation protein